MSIYTKILRQDAVYWERIGDDDQGRPLLAEPVPIRCRWQDGVEEFIDIHGTVQLSIAKVFADRDLTVGGVLWLGKMVDLAPSDDPFENTGAAQIRKANSSGNIRNTKFLRTHLLGISGVGITRGKN